MFFGIVGNAGWNLGIGGSCANSEKKESQSNLRFFQNFFSPSRLTQAAFVRLI
jgi:hypothetical protein